MKKVLIAVLIHAAACGMCADTRKAPDLRYSWRGFMLDESRHFFGKEVVRKYLDRMAENGLNVFHWHLTDDQGWRIDVPGMPELVKYGSSRPSTPTPGNSEDSDGKPYGPYYYTVGDLKEIVAYAAKKGITVVPEIEMPGHARAFLAAYPQYACDGKGLARHAWTHFGVCEDVICVGNEEAVRRCERILDEVMKIFPGKFIHIGGDECPKNKWKKCPACQARKKALGLKDEEALQAWFTSRIARYLESKGRRAVGWDEILDGGDLPKSAVIQSWRGAEGGIAAAKLGHDVVMTPNDWTYFCYPEGLPGDPYKYRPWSSVKTLPAAKMRDFDPEAGIPEEFRRHVLGGECCAWSDDIFSPEELDYKTKNRLPAFAAALTVEKDPFKAKAQEGRLSVFDFGARGDGWTDDTAAIQAGIDYLARRGGGRLFFPFTKNGYLIASPAKEFDDKGRPLRAQLEIPAGAGNIMLVGEMPCKQLYDYMVRSKALMKRGFPPTVFGANRVMNTMLRSTWTAPEVTDIKERPWAVIAAPEGKSAAGKFSATQITFANLEIRVHLDKKKMYPTMSAANFHNISRVHVRDSQFCLDDSVGDTNLGMELQENPCHTVGLIASGDQNDNQIFRNVASQGFKYGFVFGEHTCAEHLYVHNSEYAVCFADSTHPSIINRVVAQHNTRIFCTLPDGAFGRKASWVNLIVNQCDYETGEGSKPEISRMRLGVHDPSNRFRGEITYLQGWPGNGQCFFPVEGGTNLVLRALGAK